MTILFAGGEDTSFTIAGTVVYGTSPVSSQARTSFVRAFNRMLGSTADPPANRITTPTFTAGSTIWAHAQLATQAAGNGTTSNATLLRLLDAGTARILVRGTGTAGQYKISTRNAAGTITDLVTSSSGQAANLASIPVGLDLAVNYAVSGSATLYVDGISIAAFSGDVTTNSATTLNQAEFCAASTTNNHFWSEVIVATQDTRGMALWTLVPQAAGNTQSWTPNTLANINKATISDGTSISTSNNNDLSQWTTQTSAPSGAWDVRAIVQEARVRVGITGPQHFDWSLRTASTDYTGGASNAPSTSFGNFNGFIWATNPNTSGAWAIGDIASGFNLGIKALA